MGLDAGRFTRHLFVCTSGPHCPRDGDAVGIHAELKRRAKAEGLDVRVNKSGCLGQCGHGPMAVVYPEAAWYSHLALGDVDLVLEHLRSGAVATSLRYGGHGARDEPRRPDGAVDRDHPDFAPCARCA